MKKLLLIFVKGEKSLPNNKKLRIIYMCRKSEAENEYMSQIPYASFVRNLMYVMVCTRSGLAHVVNIDSRRSMAAFVFILDGSIVSWKATLQLTVNLFTTEAKLLCNVIARVEYDNPSIKFIMREPSTLDRRCHFLRSE
ncbi:copia LTR rider [Cucumis melo var. makuwa]|uniref:Copia LTR rider n=1 Tax=Cucumis melo var. makuwa TaxID=1194695 RepID=A0A5A7UJ67_CUCMM|nr:copia LTR rider [Cucumis melo var. makuwa]